jgi:hypothetical protein
MSSEIKVSSAFVVMDGVFLLYFPCLKSVLISPLLHELLVIMLRQQECMIAFAAKQGLALLYR